MTTDYVLPAFQRGGFNCPHCGAYAQQTWGTLRRDYGPDTVAHMAICFRCNKETLWYRNRQIWPQIAAGPRPNEDLGNEIIDI